MTANLFSRDWYRIADLKPALRKHVRIHAHRYRGRRWYVLEDTVTGQNRRLSAEAYWILGLMDGRRSVDDLWSLSSEKLGEDMPTHEELIQLISGLYQANVLKMDGSGDIDELFQREYEARRNKRIAKLKSPLSIQIPLIDPEKFVARTASLVAPFFTRTAAAIWLMAMLFLLVSAWQYWEPLTRGITDQVLAADNLLLLWVIYPVIKLLHEFGHAYAVKRYGGEVHEMGIMLLVLMPVPYVDASASGAFPSKYHRMLVGAAGILVELFIGAIAMLVWVNAEPGLTSSIAYNTLFIAGVSTVLINGNPLLRFDGYYVFADFLEIPNLSQKANQAWGWLVKRYAFSVIGQDRPGDSGREFAWLVGYGLAAFIYRLFLTITIVLFVAGKFFVIGVILAIWSFIGVWVWPAIKTIKKAWSDGDIKREGRNPAVVVSSMAAALIAFMGFLPFPLSTSVQGVVQYQEERRVLALENCFVDWVLEPGKSVSKGDRLMACSSPELMAALDVSKYQLAEASARRLGVWDDPVKLKLVNEEITRLKEEVEETEARRQALTLHARRDGTWWVRSAQDLIQSHLARGELIGYVAGGEYVRARALVPEKDVALVRENTRSVTAWSGATDWQVIGVDQWVVFPSVTREIPSEVLAQSGGGLVVPDPSQNEPRSLAPYFAADVMLPVGDRGLVEQRVFVQFQHDAEPLVFRLYRVVRRTFLEYFDV